MRAPQRVADVVRREPVILQVEPEIDRGFEPFLLEAPSRQHRRKKLTPDHFVTTRLVAVGAACHQKLEREALAVDAVGRPQHATVHEGAESPEIGAAEKQEMRVVLAGRRFGTRDAAPTDAS